MIGWILVDLWTYLCYEHRSAVLIMAAEIRARERASMEMEMMMIMEEENHDRVPFRSDKENISSYCETQPPASIGWEALSTFIYRLSRIGNLLLSPIYDVSDHTDHIFAGRIWSWQHISVNMCWVDPSYCCLVLSEWWWVICVCLFWINGRLVEACVI